jgi:hypothetical protein
MKKNLDEDETNAASQLANERVPNQLVLAWLFFPSPPQVAFILYARVSFIFSRRLACVGE